MSSHRRTQTRGMLGRNSRVSFMNSVAFLEPLALEWMPTRYAVAPIPGFKNGDRVMVSKPPGTPNTPSHGEGLDENLITSRQELLDREEVGEEVPRRTLRQKLYHTLNGKVDSPIEYFILLLIFLNVCCFMASTVWVDRVTGEISCVTLEQEDEDKCIQLGQKYGSFFDAFEIFSMGIFSIEYLVRFYVCVEDPIYNQYQWCAARFWWMLSFYAIIDLAAIIPTWVELAMPALNIPGFGILRICRLGRLIKAQDYIDTYSVLRDVAHQNSALLVVSCWYGFLALVFFSSVLYFTEKNWEGDSGVVFASIPKGMFATALFLTGEFTLDELSPAGEFFALVACLGTIGMLTIPVSVLAAGFIERIQNEKLRKEYLRHDRSSTIGWDPHPMAHFRHGSFEIIARTPKSEKDVKTDGLDAVHSPDFALQRLHALDEKLDKLLLLETKIDTLTSQVDKVLPTE